MSETVVATCSLGEEERARAGIYGLIARLLSAHPNAESLKEIAEFPADETPIGSALGELAEAASKTSETEAEDEYNTLFIGVTEGELIPFASHYLTGFLNDKPLANVRDDLSRLGIERSEEIKEPEDHIAFLFDVMVGLITKQFGADAGDDEEEKFFENHISPWAEKFFSDLKNAESANFYKPLGTLGLRFLDVETKGFRIAS
ncbi:molecular chaperone TorD family protein [Terasakiella sp. A23]|uniref:TorD/DmsD family molecular chaperone n=1 Tax=Terasakiella sp. FCG-A23 TaxID=3080561 RepID=UPI00295365AB|nr:molecular chaperone TorD family protein [Terasakiella sp. A23]MDV7340230.1 molecular chaperone TorD family protein [Terasakiella sp. A23]